MLKTARRARNKQGASIALAAAFFFVCVLLIYFGFNMSVLMGGSRQVRNAVDAAVLNVGKRSMETKVNTKAAFSDVGDSCGKVGLSNINRVWGKALLINANAEEMQKEGLSTGSASGNAVTAYQTAKQINDELVEELTDPVRLNMYFRHTSKQRGAALLGTEATLDRSKDTRYQIAMVGRGDESNIRFKQDQLPGKTEVGKVELGGTNFLQGYQSMTINGRPFMFTTFHQSEMPHLIADSIFEKCKPTTAPLSNFANPIPNAWHASGVVDGEKGSMRASASAVANPQRYFDLAIPFGYINIQVQNKSLWYVEGILKVPPIFYKSEPNQKILGLPDAKLSDGKKFNGYANLGNEFNQPSLLAYMDMTGGDKELVYDKMTQRLKQVDPNFTKQQLKKLLDSLQIVTSEEEYYIFPTYSTADHTGPRITVGSKMSKLPGWLNKSLKAEGASKPVVQEKVLIGTPNNAFGISEIPPDPRAGTKFTGTISWQPGTGYNQCLGTVRMARETRINFVKTGEDPLKGI